MDNPYDNNGNNGESRRLISGVKEVTKRRKTEGFLYPLDIDKSSDSLDHNYLVSILQKYISGKNFIFWVKILLKDQEWCVLNGGKTKKYFLFWRGVC